MKTILISGKQGSGKTSLVNALTQNNIIEFEFTNKPKEIWQMLRPNLIWIKKNKPIIVIDETFPE